MQACGDAHLSNFGVFGSAERRLVFDVNDFDETLPGPWEWDVKRLAASLEIAGRGQRVAPPSSAARSSWPPCPATGRPCANSAAHDRPGRLVRGTLDVTELRAQIDAQLRARQRKLLDQSLAKAQTRDSMQELGKLTRVVDGRPRIISDPPLLVPVDELIPAETERADLEGELTSLLAKYRRTLETDRRYLLDQFEFSDMARKVVGVGSVGTRCWIVLMLGRDESDPLFLQVKEAEASVLSRFVGTSKYPNQGQRVVAGQRLMQATSDIFLGWQRIEAGLDGQSRDFYVRQLRDWKFSVEIATLRPEGLQMYGGMCGWTLARAHARSGDRIAIAAYLGGSDVFDRAIARFASAYADQNERDHQAVVDAVKSGRITAEQGL